MSLSFKSIKQFDLQLCYQQSLLFSKTFPRFLENYLSLLEYLHFKQNNFSKGLKNHHYLYTFNELLLE